MIVKGLQCIACADSNMLITAVTHCLYCSIVNHLPFLPQINNSYSQFWFLCCPCRQSQVRPGASVVLYGAGRPRGRASGNGFGPAALQRLPCSTGSLHLQRQNTPVSISSHSVSAFSHILFLSHSAHVFNPK